MEKRRSIKSNELINLIDAIESDNTENVFNLVDIFDEYFNSLNLEDDTEYTVLPEDE